jgi:hypothetical protein
MSEDFQEALVRQVNDMVQLLGPDNWDFVREESDAGATTN